MQNDSLPPTEFPTLIGALPEAPDLQTGLEFIANLPLHDAAMTDSQLHRLLDNLLVSPPPADVYLCLLEQSQASLHHAEEELAHRYIHKPLPLEDAEDAVFLQVVTTWCKVARAYAHCAQVDFNNDDPEHLLRVALILHRCIYYTGLAVVEHHRARRELPPGLWLDLQGYYATAEEWGVATLAIPDAVDAQGRSTHCAAEFIGLLLFEAAGPYGLTIRDQALVRRWAKDWAPLASLLPCITGKRLPRLIVDLMHDGGLHPGASDASLEDLRRLDTSRLSMQINQIRLQLRQRISPRELGLGEDCSAGQCNRLLEHLTQPWSLEQATRRFRRHASSGTARVCQGFEAMHYFISGKEFALPGNMRDYSRHEMESLFTFRHMVDPSQQLELRHEQLGFSYDKWEILNQSANGFRLMRKVAGKKVVQGQLLAICPHDGEHFFLAQAPWLMQEQQGGLVSGVAALPGVPIALAARPQIQLAGVSEDYSRAFLLPAVPAVGSEQSLVLPQSWYLAGRVIEIFTDHVWLAKLTGVLDDGPDFERVSFVVV